MLELKSSSAAEIKQSESEKPLEQAKAKHKKELQSLIQSHDLLKKKFEKEIEDLIKTYKKDKQSQASQTFDQSHLLIEEYKQKFEHLKAKDNMHKSEIQFLKSEYEILN